MNWSCGHAARAPSPFDPSHVDPRHGRATRDVRSPARSPAHRSEPPWGSSAVSARNRIVRTVGRFLSNRPVSVPMGCLALPGGGLHRLPLLANRGPPKGGRCLRLPTDPLGVFNTGDVAQRLEPWGISPLQPVTPRDKPPGINPPCHQGCTAPPRLTVRSCRFIDRVRVQSMAKQRLRLSICRRAGPMMPGRPSRSLPASRHTVTSERV